MLSEEGLIYFGLIFFFFKFILVHLASTLIVFFKFLSRLNYMAFAFAVTKLQN